MIAAPEPLPRLRFDRHELAGAFGDIGTDLPRERFVRLVEVLLVLSGAQLIVTALVGR